MSASNRDAVVQATADIARQLLDRELVSAEGLPAVIDQVGAALARVADLPAAGVPVPEMSRAAPVPGAPSPATGPAPAPATPVPAVPPAESIQPDYLICLEDGRQLKMLKRYLRTTYNMTPEQYRARWGLPEDYPMVAPNYRAARQRMVKRGAGGGFSGTAPAPVATEA